MDAGIKSNLCCQLAGPAVTDSTNLLEFRKVILYMEMLCHIWDCIDNLKDTWRKKIYV